MMMQIQGRAADSNVIPIMFLNVLSSALYPVRAFQRDIDTNRDALSPPAEVISGQ